MPRIERSATVVWDGNVARGGGHLSGDTGAFTELPFTLASRIGSPEGKTSPEELLAAAHAGCFTMSLGSELARDSTPAGHLEVHCTILMDEIPGEGHQIVGSTVTVQADVEGTTDESLAAAIGRADEGCPFSTLLRKSGAEVRVSRA
jgi:osmotically inducible protein OsmC